VEIDIRNDENENDKRTSYILVKKEEKSF